MFVFSGFWGTWLIRNVSVARVRLFRFRTRVARPGCLAPCYLPLMALAAYRRIQAGCRGVTEAHRVCISDRMRRL